MKPFFFLVMLPCAFLARPAHASALLKPTSGVTQALAPKSLRVESKLRGAFAQTMVTTVYANPNSQQIEADFMYSAPKGSVVTGFAYWYREEKVVARVVEKGRAAKIYQYITSRMRDPALIEMVGPNKFRARIFPVEAGADLKIEVRLAQALTATKSGQSWNWPLREETSGGALQNISIHLQSDRAFSSNLGKVQNNELKFHRTKFKATGDARALVPQNPAPLRASLLAARDGGQDGFFALALTSNSPVALPRFQMSGISTYEVLVPTMRRLGANGNFVVLGRYRGSGNALVSLNGRSVQVRFPDAQEANNLPSLLWASGRIESLSSREKNKAQVMALSKRFGVPSKWTSWLAIPEEERRNFKRQMWASDRSDAAKAYAQAVARGDGAAMKAQKAAFDDLTKKLKADGPNYADDEELQPLASYLNDELRHLQRAMVQAKYDKKISKAQRLQWAKWTKNLQKAGATDDGEGVDLPVYVVEDELRIASRLYLQEIEAGRKKGATARRYQARLKELAGTKTAQQYGWDETSFIEEQAEVRANALAMDIAVNRASDKPDRKRLRQAEQRLARLEREDIIDTEEALETALAQIWGAKIKVVAQRWADEIEAGRPTSSTAQKFARQVRALQKRSGIQNVDVVNEAWNTLASQTGGRHAEAIRAEGPKGPTARKLDAQVTRMAAQAKRPPQELRKAAWQEVAQKIGTRLTAQLTATRSATPQTRALQSQLEVIGRTYKVDAVSQVQVAWGKVVDQTADKLAVEVRAGRENSEKARALEAQLQEARKHAYSPTYIPWELRSAWKDRANAVANEVVEKTVKKSPGVEELKKQGHVFAVKSDEGKFNDFVTQAATQKMDELRTQIAEEIGAKRENGTKIEALRSELAKLEEGFPETEKYWGYKENFAWEGRAHEAAYRLLEAQKTEPANTSKIDSLQRELEQSAQKGGKFVDKVLAWEKTRLAKNEPLITASDYRLRSGDPLISVMAPANCRQVVAQMPDGTLLPLRYDPLKRVWEARFDVPTFVSDGDYRVRILIVSPEGKRRSLTMNFAVDSKAPQGTGKVETDGKTWRLSLKSDEHTDRVSAFLPWNERVELRRDESAAFVADVPVPEAFQKSKGQVRFVLTDAAHNRTEISLDWN